MGQNGSWICLSDFAFPRHGTRIYRIGKKLKRSFSYFLIDYIHLTHCIQIRRLARLTAGLQGPPRLETAAGCTEDEHVSNRSCSESGNYYI